MARMLTRKQISSGGVAFRKIKDQVEVVLISVGSEPRWQLPKGRVDPGETTEITALREVREEAGVTTELLSPINDIVYWFHSTEAGQRVRIHKVVHFYLVRYLDGDPSAHDFEVNEARWFEIGQAAQLLTYQSERQVLERARELIAQLPEVSPDQQA